MKHHVKRITQQIFALLIVGGVTILTYIIGTTWIENRIEEKLATIPAKASSININLFSRSITLTDFELYPSDSSPFSLRLKKLTIEGIDIQALLNENKIAVKQFRADSGKVSYDKSLVGAIKSSDSLPTKFNDLFIKNLRFSNIICEMVDDTVLVASAVANLNASGISTKLNSLDTFSSEIFNGSIKSINVNRGIKMYRLSVGTLLFNSEQKSITADSAFLIPNYPKFEFAHHKGEQVGRVSIFIPAIIVRGIDFSKIKDSSFVASQLEIRSFDLHSFKDKRIPFLRDFTIPLPMESFRSVPYAISVDSLIIKDSRVTIEEITEKGMESGVVVIEKINANCGRVTNRYTERFSRIASLKATGSLMNSGEIKATFTLPLDGSPTYYARGSISKLPFEKLNPALENMARFRIETGDLNNLKFDFQYNDEVSVGTLEIDYEDLKITGLKRKNGGTSDIKTFLINAIVKNDKTRTLPKMRRTGTINIERDKRRYVFNVWWKSILDGLGSAILGIGRKEKSRKTKS